MKVVIAPDSFKESLSAVEVARSISEGVLRACSNAMIDLCPMADGGEGTVEAMVAATNGELLSAEAFGPLREPVTARFGLLGGNENSKVAVIEMAGASGLEIVPADKRNPLVTTTFGTGQLILAALDAGANEILIGIGGSATVDGGCGCAQAIGLTFISKSGKPCTCGMGGGSLLQVDKIDISDRDPRIADTRIRVACDVTNPLTGPNGAAAVYGPQKGATEEMVTQLDAGLAHLARVIKRQLGLKIDQMPGAGAAGGLGGGLMAFAGAKLEPGLSIVAEELKLAERLSGADLCITGEGKFDSQSLSGKTAVGVAQIAAKQGVPVICIPGQADKNVDCDLFADIRPLVADDVRVEDAIKNPKALLQKRSMEAVQNFLQKLDD